MFFFSTGTGPRFRNYEYIGLPQKFVCTSYTWGCLWSFNPTVTFQEGSSKNMKLVKFLSHWTHLPGLALLLTPQHHWHRWPVHLMHERKPLWSHMHIGVSSAAYSTDSSQFIYFICNIMLQWALATFLETRVWNRSSGRRAILCVCSAGCREKMNTAAALNRETDKELPE